MDPGGKSGMTGLRPERGQINATVEIRDKNGKLKTEIYLTSDIELNADPSQYDDDDTIETEAPLDDNLAP